VEGGFLHEIVFTLIAGAILIVPARRIFGRAGLNPAIAWTVFIPFVGYLIAYLALAFMRWPAAGGEATNAAGPGAGHGSP
jgi:hypothetical protein